MQKTIDVQAEANMRHSSHPQLRFLATIAVAITLIACGGESASIASPNAAVPPRVVRIDVKPDSVAIGVGQSVSFTATPRDSAGNAVDARVSWSGTDQNGELTGTASGNTLTLTAHAAVKAAVFASIGIVGGKAIVVVQ